MNWLIQTCLAVFVICFSRVQKVETRSTLCSVHWDRLFLRFWTVSVPKSPCHFQRFAAAAAKTNINSLKGKHRTIEKVIPGKNPSSRVPEALRQVTKRTCGGPLA